MKVFILLSIIGIALAVRTCPENQHYDSCGTACPLTCKNYKNPPVACVLMCVPGCHCDEEYVKTKDGSCVKPENCPMEANQVCQENQQYMQCGTACPLTCDNFDNPPRICPAMCVSGCHCVKGFVKTADGRCVRPENCPSRSRNVEKTCLAEPDPGMCRGFFPKFYYDVQTGTCKEFIYGGCQGNGNNYNTEEECLEHCKDVRVKQSSSNVCDLPSDTGLCRGFFPRYHFDKTTGQCERFVYGGCGGNGNNFKTKTECEQTCGNRAAETKEVDCNAPAEPGLCYARIPRYYYDQDEGCCKKFIYGGCGGNSNNFRTKDECRKNCEDVSVCEQEKVVGPCRAAFPRFYFNKQTGQCESFIYGGCLGNGNNFLSQEDCESTCVG